MFGSRIKLLPGLCNKVLGANVSSKPLSLEGSSGKLKWDLVSGVCLERRPILTSSPTDLELKFEKLLQDIEFENSFKSDHEVRKENERKYLEQQKKGNISADFDVVLQQTAQDLEDAYQDESSKFKYADRCTDADVRKDLQSLERALDKYLVLLVHQRIGDGFVWSLPQGSRESGETMRQAAERVLLEKCGDSVKAKFIGNSPCGFYKYKYPVSMRSSQPNCAVGAKVFFFKAWHLGGHIDCPNDSVKNFKWLSQEELLGDLPDEYFKSISQFLITS